MQRNQIQSVSMCESECHRKNVSYPLEEQFSRLNIVKLVQRCSFLKFPAVCSQIHIYIINLGDL